MAELLIVGARGGTNVGESLYEGARTLGIRAELLDSRRAWSGPWLAQKVSWHLMGHRPWRLREFSRSVLEACKAQRPRWLLTVGIAPVDAQALRSVRNLGVNTLNFLTDDPWNPAHASAWAFESTREYSCVISPRRANMHDLRALGCPEVRYVPFGFDPRHFFPEPPDPKLASDVIFVGGGDADRVPWMRALLDAGFRLALYGSYWDRFAGTRGHSRGQHGPDVIRRATVSAKVAVCLVRRANRDGHVMRSLEIPATGTCMVAEDTEEHRELFGDDDECVAYFRTPDELVSLVRALLQDDARRSRLAKAAHARVTGGGYSYADRLAEMLDLPRHALASTDSASRT
jgi:spore maturation protein CgeB